MPGALGVSRSNFNDIGEFFDQFNSAGITAFAGGGQSGATQLMSQYNRISTVATAQDSVRLPQSNPGRSVVVNNQAALAMQVFGFGAETVNSIATATGWTQSAKTVVIYTCNVAGNWESYLSGSTTASIVALTTNGAINPKASQTYVITKAGVLADTLAAPVATTDDGVIITITSDTANAHTLTATGLLDTGTASVNLATFAGSKGAGLTLMAYNARWKVMYSVGITFS